MIGSKSSCGTVTWCCDVKNEILYKTCKKLLLPIQIIEQSSANFVFVSHLWEFFFCTLWYLMYEHINYAIVLPVNIHNYWKPQDTLFGHVQLWPNVLELTRRRIGIAKPVFKNRNIGNQLDVYLHYEGMSIELIQIKVLYSSCEEREVQIRNPWSK